jgi:hypothetical protein
LLLSPLPHARPLISPRKISPFHDVYVQPLTKQNIPSPSARTLTFTIEQSPSKVYMLSFKRKPCFFNYNNFSSPFKQDLQKINSLINQSRQLSVAKRFNIDCEPEFPPNKVAKDSIKLLISDREEFSN